MTVTYFFSTPRGILELDSRGKAEQNNRSCCRGAKEVGGPGWVGSSKSLTTRAREVFLQERVQKGGVEDERGVGRREREREEKEKGETE